MTSMYPQRPVLHTGVLELVGADERVDQNELGVAVSASIDGGNTSSGVILAAAFYATESGTGAIQDSAGELLVFTADPGHSVGDDGSGVSGAEWKTCIASIAVATTDWVTEDNGGIAHICSDPIPFYGLATLYFVWHHTDATSLNDGAGDNEVLDVDVYYQLYSREA